MVSNRFQSILNYMDCPTPLIEQRRRPALIGAMLLGAILLARSGQTAAYATDGGLPPDGCCGRAASLTTSDCRCLWCRDQLTGDWLGARTGLAEAGITADFDATMFYLGVADAGLEQAFRFGGHDDYVINMDFGRLRVRQGLFLKLRAEHRYGESLAGATGAFLPSNLVADLPVADSENLYLTNVLFTQMLSENFGLFAGKLDTLDGDQNAFASGRGKTQFSNVAFVITPIGLRTIVYSTLGAGFVILRDGEPLLTFSVLNATDTARTSGFEELFADGVALVPELRLPTNFFGLPGHQLFGATWSSRNFAALDQDPLVILPSVPIERESDSWALYWNFDQYLFVDPCQPQRGWGLFGRAGIADDATNPIGWFLSFGVGGQGMFRARPSDSFGVGWYYSGTSNELAPFLETALGGIGDGQGIELYYNFQVTPSMHVTPDLQILMPARDTVDTTTVVGLRARVIF